MSSILRVFLLLAVVVCISQAQFLDSRSSCLCRRVRKGLVPGSDLSNIHVHQPSVYCDKTEIVITTRDNQAYCLNPKTKAGKKVLEIFMERKSNSTANSTSPL